MACQSLCSTHSTMHADRISLRIRSPKSLAEWSWKVPVYGVNSGSLYKGFRTTDPQRNAMGQILRGHHLIW